MGEVGRGEGGWEGGSVRRKRDLLVTISTAPPPPSPPPPRRKKKVLMLECFRVTKENCKKRVVTRPGKGGGVGVGWDGMGGRRKWGKWGGRREGKERVKPTKIRQQRPGCLGAPPQRPKQPIIEQIQKGRRQVVATACQYWSANNGSWVSYLPLPARKHCLVPRSLTILQPPSPRKAPLFPFHALFRATKPAALSRQSVRSIPTCSQHSRLSWFSFPIPWLNHPSEIDT